MLLFVGVLLGAPSAGAQGAGPPASDAHLLSVSAVTTPGSGGARTVSLALSYSASYPTVGSSKVLPLAVYRIPRIVADPQVLELRRNGRPVFVLPERLRIDRRELSVSAKGSLQLTVSVDTPKATLVVVLGDREITKDPTPNDNFRVVAVDDKGVASR